MTADQMIGYTLLNTSSITAIVSTRIYHGMRGMGTALPALNFYQLGQRTRANGMERTKYSICSRATTAASALALASLVYTLFDGSSGNGMKGDINNFAIISSSVIGTGGLIFEEEESVYNAPVDIQVVYPVTTAT